MLRFVILPFVLALSTPALAAEPIADTDWAGRAFGAEVRGPSSGGDVSADDLLRLRDLGGLSVSPDGRWLAFSVRQAIPEANAYVLRWFVMPADASSGPAPLDQDGGQPIPSMLYGLPQAYVPPEAARWSADSKHFAFRRLEDHRIELWDVDVSTRIAVRVADGEAQVSAFTWAQNDLVYRTGLNFRTFQRNASTEARRGLLLDGRMPLAAGPARLSQPNCSLASNIDAACDNRTYAVAANHRSRPATSDEVAALQFQIDSKGPAALSAVRSDGLAVQAAIADPADSKAATPLRRIALDGPEPPVCEATECWGARFRQLGWARNGESIWFLKSESSVGNIDGAPADASALYEWRPSRREVHTVVRGSDLIEDCQVRGAKAFCMREAVRRPRHIVVIDLDTGALKVLADPNPMFSSKAFPRIDKLDVVDFKGDPAFAHVVYPNNYDPRRRYPLVVTQYRSKGFLRGQVGNEFPIFPLAAEGFVVLSLDRPEEYRAMLTQDNMAVGRLGYTQDLRDRRSVFSAIQRLIDKLVADGVVDKDRMAITGLSAGAESVHYTLQHTRQFAAAITSSGIHDETFLAVIPQGLNRERLKDLFQAKGVVPAEGSALNQLAWSKMPHRLSTPLLINVGEYERAIGFEGIEALKDGGRPVEVRVFPDEQHIKYHPQTLAGIYDNNITWLKFWLLDVEDNEPAHQSEYQRWRAMRDQLRKERTVN